MQIQGICYLAKKWDKESKTFIEEKDFNRYDKYATGKLTWGDNVKDKDGVVSKSYTNKRFISFDARAIDVLDACRKDLIVIEGQLRTESYIAKNGDKVSQEKVIISKVDRYEKKDSIPVKQEVKEVVVDDSLDDIPF